jgi:hypothetical protein
VTGDPIGEVPLSNVNRTLPPFALPVASVTFAKSVNVWSLALAVAQVANAVVPVAGEPLPDKVTTWGEFPASSIKESEAARAPLAEGWNVIESVQFKPTAKSEPHVSWTAKSDAFGPSIEILFTFNGDLPVLMTPIDWDALATPTG